MSFNISFFNEKNTSVQWASYKNTLYGEFALGVNSDFVKKELKNIPMDSFNFRKHGSTCVDSTIVIGVPSSNLADEVKANFKDWITPETVLVSDDKIQLDYNFPENYSKVVIKVEQPSN